MFRLIFSGEKKIIIIFNEIISNYSLIFVDKNAYYSYFVNIKILMVFIECIL